DLDRAPLEPSDRSRPKLLFGSLHRLRQTIGESAPRLGRAVIVLSRGDVSRTPGEVDSLPAGRLLVATRASETDEVARDAAVAVVAHRMGRVVVERGDGLVAIEPRDRLEARIDETFGELLQTWIARRARTPRDELAIAIDDAAVRRDPIDARLADGDVR